MSVYAVYQNTCSTRQWNSCDCYTLLWSTRRCGRLQYGCADWRKNCSTPHSSCCAKRSHNPLHRNYDKCLCTGAGWTNTAPSFHNCNYGRWNRSSQILFDHKHSYTSDSRCWCRSRPAHSEESMYGCRIPGRCPTHKHRIRDFWWCMFLNIGRNDTRCIRCNLRGRVTNVRLQRTRLGMNIFHSLGSCR